MVSSNLSSEVWAVCLQRDEASASGRPSKMTLFVEEPDNERYLTLPIDEGGRHYVISFNFNILN